MRRGGTVVTFLLATAIGLGTGIAIPGVLLRESSVEEPLAADERPVQGKAGAMLRTPLSAAVQGAPDFRAVVKEVIPSVVTVRSQRTVEVSRSPFPFNPFEEFFGVPRGRQPRTDRYLQRGLGSGVIVDARGYILTNNHVIEDSSRIEVTLPGGKISPATVKGADPQSDLAVLKIDEPALQPIPFGRSADLEVGEWVLAIGNPFAESLAHTVTAGIVSAKGRSNLNLADYEDFIQTDAAINPGNSGGALVNTRGELVGINTAIASGSGGSQGIGFAIPVDMARQIMDTLIRSGKVVRGYIGVTIQDLTPEMAQAAGIQAQFGAILASVAENSPAAEAGLKQGDVLLEVDGRSVRDTVEVRNLIAATPPGSRVRLTVERDGRRRDVPVTLGEQPSQRAAAQAPGGGAEEGLGLSVRNLTPQIADQLGVEEERGVVITDVEAGSSADSAGLRRGDLIKEVNRRPVVSVVEFRDALSKRVGAEVVLLLVRRGDDAFYVTVRNR